MVKNIIHILEIFNILEYEIYTGLSVIAVFWTWNENNLNKNSN